jgi:hypothetical protein
MTFVCKFCEREFKRESSFLKHSCKEKERFELMSSYIGKKSYFFYELWMLSYKRKVPTIEVFMTSQYFNAFVRFAEYVDKVKLYSPDLFIKLMKELDISPTLWCDSELFDVYQSWLDMRHDPMDHVNTTVETLFNLTEIFNCQTVKDALFKLHPREMIQLIRNRKISLYVVLCSKVFKEVISRMEAHDKHEMSRLLNVDYISKKFDSDKKLLTDVKTIVGELGI